ncbi:hydrolase [Streptomyces tropicalis]|uniref:Hydrolase n=1 Tax=Streptomyces tropicalis TaxID=3034234 RepID=A0ABT6AE97_9ACTN|nr:hydrolase [Streptomyces tropicalis]MDF3302974.1 hydrolase [Streptomyces tropicalis]
MSLWTLLEPPSATVDPGGATTVRLRLRNTGDVVDEYRFEPVGPLAPWTTVEPPALRLYPGTTGTAELTVAPPRTPDAAAGPHPYAVRITPTEHPEAVTVPEGNMTVTPFTEVRAELVPPTVKGRFRGRPRLAVDNVGNTRVTASVSGSDPGDQLSYDVRPGSVQIEPGRAAFVRATLRPRRIIWFGPKEERPYTLAVQRSGVVPLPVEGTYVQRGFLPRWLAGLLGALVALAVTFVMLWIAYRPQVASKATEQVQEAGVSTLAPSTSAPAPPPSPTVQATTPPAAPETSAAPGAGGSGGGGGGAGAAKPAPETAATVVSRLAAKDPGRHICYRAYILGEGWQRPVCDGAMAGTVGEGAKIGSLNIAVSGTKGTAANAFVHEDHWKTPWSGVVDGVDNYIGSTRKDDPYMLGFAINVGDGRACQNALVHGHDWGGLHCDEPGGYIFGGTLDDALWLEAVRFTV